METKIIKCELCGHPMKTRVNGSHLMRKHSITLEEYKKQFPCAEIGKRTPNLITYTCKVCGKSFKSSSSLSRHLNLKYNMSLGEYYIKYYLNDQSPLCKCGCNGKPTFDNMEEGFHDYILHHGPHISQNNLDILRRSLKVDKTKTIDISLEILDRDKVEIICKSSPHNYTKILKSLYPKTYEYIEHNYKNTHDIQKRFAERVYKYIYGENTNKCVMCGGDTTFLYFRKGYHRYCSQKCQQLGTANAYGVENLFQSEEIKSKIKQTCQKKFGVDSPMKNKEVVLKGKRIKKELYGNENYNNPEQYKKTNLERYGVENPNQLDSVKKKITDTHIKRYGKIFNNRDKAKKTSLERYGVEHACQNSEVMENFIKNCYKFKEYILPSKKKIKYQGYENFALDLLLKIYDENDIIIDRRYTPEIWYFQNNKKKRYFPDIYIPSKNLIIEVKSEWTINLHEEIDKLKEESVLKNGYNFKKFIFTKKGELL